MKKVVAILLSICFVLCLTACGSNDSTVNNDTGSSSCMDCGVKVERTDNFCKNCGIALKSNEETSDDTKNETSQVADNNSVEEENVFTVGKTLKCSTGVNFEMTLLGTGDEVQIKDLKITQYKKADRNNQEDYFSEGVFYPYIYEVTYNGKTSEKYAGYELSIEFGFPSGSPAFKSIHNNVINNDGSLDMKYYLYSNSLETEISPNWVSATPKMF